MASGAYTHTHTRIHLHIESDLKKPGAHRPVAGTPGLKTVRILKLLTFIHSPLKVDHFELLVNWSNIVRFMINERTSCKIYITHLMI